MAQNAVPEEQKERRMLNFFARTPSTPNPYIQKIEIMLPSIFQKLKTNRGVSAA